MSTHPYRLGDHGPAVAEIRAKLVQLGLLADDVTARRPEEASFDDDTDRAVRHFQQQRGLNASGIVDPETFRVLDEACWRLGDRLLTYHVGNPVIGDDIVTLQQRLKDLGFDVGRVDGVYGAIVERSVREFQRTVGLPADGSCGPATFKALARDRAGSIPAQSGGQVRRGGSPAAGGQRVSPSLAGKVVVIDPGHGGDDHGHVANGLSEADIAFELASRIEGRLNATGVRAFLTRGRHNCPDEAVRAEFANETGADLVVSLHVDSYPNAKASGVATYYYGSGLTDNPHTVGARFAGLIQREIVARTDLLDGKTHPRSQDLLRYTKMPAVRVELGYLTNPGDAARLGDSGFRDMIAEAIVVAVQRVYLAPDQDAPTGVMRLSELMLTEGAETGPAG